MRISDWSSDVCSSDLIAPSILPYVCTRSRRTLGLVPARRWPLRLADADVRHRHASLGELDLFGMECLARQVKVDRSEEHTSELQSLMRNSYAVFCLKKKNTTQYHQM